MTTEVTPSPADQQHADPIARLEISTLKEDVRGISRDVHSLRQNMATKEDFSALRISIEKSENDRRPQWQAYGVMLTAVLAIGALAWWPIRETMVDLKSSTNDITKNLTNLVVLLPEKFASTRELDNIRTRLSADSEQLRSALGQMPDKYVSNREHDRLLHQIEGMVGRTELQALIADRDARLGGAVRRIERIEAGLLRLNPRVRIQGDEP